MILSPAVGITYEISTAGYGIDISFLFKLRICTLDRIGINRQIHGQVSDRRKLFIGRQSAVYDEADQLLSDLLIQRAFISIVDKYHGFLLS